MTSVHRRGRLDYLLNFLSKSEIVFLLRVLLDEPPWLYADQGALGLYGPGGGGGGGGVVGNTQRSVVPDVGGGTSAEICSAILEPLTRFNSS